MDNHYYYAPARAYRPQRGRGHSSYILNNIIMYSESQTAAVTMINYKPLSDLRYT